MNVACSVHQEFRKISFGSQKPQDLVRLGPGVVSVPVESEVCVACDVVVFANAVPIDKLRGRSESRSRETCAGEMQQHL